MKPKRQSNANVVRIRQSVIDYITSEGEFNETISDVLERLLGKRFLSYLKENEGKDKGKHKKTV